MDEDLIEAVSAHITRHVGEPTNVLHELIPTDDVHVDLHVVAPTPSRPFYTVVTSGMSEQPMTLPAEFEGQLSPYAELMLCLPEDWKVDATTDERWNWPLKWLWFLAKYPHQFGTFLTVSHTIPNSEDCDPFGPGTAQCCWFLRTPQTTPVGFAELEHDGRTIPFLALTAIHKGEMEFAISNGVDTLYALDRALAEAAVTELVHAARPQLSLSALRRHRTMQWRPS